MCRKNFLERNYLDDPFDDISLIMEFGGDGSEMRLYSDLEDKTEFFDFSLYKEPENQDTFIYLRDHGGDVFSGKDPNMKLHSLAFCSMSHDDIDILFKFKLSKELANTNIDNLLILNRSLDDPTFGLSIHREGQKPECHSMGLVKGKDDTAFVEFYFDEGPATRAEFTFSRKDSNA